MADNYLEFSEIIANLTPDEIEWWENEAERVDDMLDKCPENLDDDNPLCLDFVVENKKQQVWFHADEFGNPDEVANVVQRFLKQFHPQRLLFPNMG